LPDFPIVDSHVHLCDPKRFGYAWMKDAPALDRQVLPGEFIAAARPVEIERFVFVEVDVDPLYRHEEAAWVDDLSRSEPRLAGMVASLPLEKGAAVGQELDTLLEHQTLRGVRRLIQAEPDPDFCTQPDFIDGLKLLARHDLLFDICILHHQLPSAIRMVQRCPEVSFVLDHIGKPDIKAGVLDPWRAHIKELASLPNVTCKISGVITEADHKAWTREELKPYIAHAIEVFGFDRILFGGDWHVVELAGTHPEWVAVVDWVVEDCSPEEKRKLFRDNAVRTYRL
jgi:L-fuconolactonase